MRGVEVFLFYGVGGEESGFAALGLNRFDARLAALFIAAEHGDFRAGLGQAFGQSPTQGTGSADYNRNFPRKIEKVHGTIVG